MFQGNETNSPQFNIVKYEFRMLQHYLFHFSSIFFFSHTLSVSEEKVLYSDREIVNIKWDTVQVHLWSCVTNLVKITDRWLSSVSSVR